MNRYPCINMKRLIVILITLGLTSVQALELPTIFSDLMVFQREVPVHIWGKAKPGASVKVEFASQKVTTEAAEDGSWAVYLKPMEASFEGRDLEVASGGDKKTFHEVLVGEVWLGSGQSNMAWNVEMCADGDILLLMANDPYLRLHQVNYAVAREPRFSDEWPWFPDRPQSTRYISSVAYQFARDMRAALKVPVGIINSSVGGTPSIAWTRSETILSNPVLRARDEEWEAALARYDEDLSAWDARYTEWLAENGIEDREYEAHLRQGAPRKPEDAASPRRPASLANGMVAPIAGYTVRGVLWYQGEEDAKWDPANYDERLRLMIADWRDWWGVKDLPFGVVQLANFMKPMENPTNGPWANIRESQRSVAASDSGVGLVVAIDAGEADDIHPRDKFTIARRLARWALADVYNKLTLAGGPVITGAVMEGSDVLLSFEQTGSGLHSMDAQTLGGFTASDSLTGPSQGTAFYPVAARIRSKTEVLLEVPEGRKPLRVRYGWQSNPEDANLTNRERLPASPFAIKISR